MNHRKQGRRLAGLVAVVALTMMAFASMAQAEGKALGFFVNGAVAPSNLHVELGGQQLGNANALLLPVFKIEIKCENILGPASLPLRRA